MNVKMAQNLTEKTLAERDIQQYLEKLIAEINEGIERDAKAGKWSYQHKLTNHVANYDLLDHLVDHYMNEGFDVRLTQSHHDTEDTVMDFNTAMFTVYWNRKLKDIRRNEGVDSTEPKSAASPPAGARPRKGGTPMAVPAEEGRDSANLQGVSVDERRAASAA